MIPTVLLKTRDGRIWKSSSRQDNRPRILGPCLNNSELDENDRAALRFLMNNDVPGIDIKYEHLKLVANYRTMRVTVPLHQPLRRATAIALKRLTKIFEAIQNATPITEFSCDDDMYCSEINDPRDDYRRAAVAELQRLQLDWNNPSLVETVAISLAFTRSLPAELSRQF